MLMSLLHGGDGHTTDWIEQVIYDATPTLPQVPAFVLHNYDRFGVEVSVFHTCCERFARNMYMLFNDGGALCNSQIDTEEIERRHNAIPITNTGRHIAEPQQYDRFDTLTFLREK